MSNYRFTSDLLADILFRSSEPTDGTSDFAAKALEYLNRAYESLCDGGSELDPSVREDWWWLRKHPPGVLTLKPAITTGTVTCTNNSTSITLSSGPAATVAGYFFRVSGEPDVFRILTHTAASTSAVLDSVYTGDTGSGLSYTLIPLEYDLASDVLRLTAPMRIYRTAGYSEDDYEVHGVDINVLEEDSPLAIVEQGNPDLFAHVTETKVRFNRYPTELTRVDYDYIYRPTDLTTPGTSEEPVVPRNRRKVLADLACAWLMVDKDDNRSTGVAEIARRGLLSMSLENRHRLRAMSDTAGQLKPRKGGPRRRRGPLRTFSGLIIG